MQKFYLYTNDFINKSLPGVITAVSYFRPTDLDYALGWLADHRDGQIVAGCTDLFARTDQEYLNGPILDITAIKGLKGVEKTDNGWRFGAATTWSDILRADLPPAFECLKLAARELGSPQIQNSATLTGNLCNASPAADGIPCLLTLDASIELASIRGSRTLALTDFITGPRQTKLSDEEMVTAIRIPSQASKGTSHFQKLGARKYLVISIAMVATRLVIEDGIILDAALSVGACSPVAMRLSDMEAALMDKPAQISTIVTVQDSMFQEFLQPIDDIRADSLYRSTAAAELIRRSLTQLLSNASEIAA